MALPPEQRHPFYEAWRQVYAGAKDACAWKDALEFLNDSPGAINNRGGGSESTLLHQAAYWGIDRGTIGRLKDFGADPTILNKAGKAPLDMARPGKRQEMQSIFVDVFGADDSRLRQLILQEARNGNFYQVMHHLRRSPHLVNTQSPFSGYSVMHQAAYHGVGAGLIAALSNLGASWELMTHEGKTAADILRERHPGSTLSIPCRRTPATFNVGDTVLLHSPQGWTRTVVESTFGDMVTVTGPKDVPRWRLSPIGMGLSDAEMEGAAGMPEPCCICFTLVPLKWKVSQECSGEPHPICGDCMATFLWSQFTTPKLPIKCFRCDSMVDMDGMPRNVLRSWPPGSSSSNPCTGISWREFQANVREKFESGQHVDDDGYKLHMLQTCDNLVVQYSNVSAPSMRACPSCRTLIEYGGACKHFDCTQCEHQFCWLCLRSRGEHDSAEFNWAYAHPCPVAPVQTLTEDATAQ